MRTKTLLLTAALGAVGVASAVAQVYSVNAVGYVNKQVAAGFNLLANPLNTGGNTVAEVLPTVPDGSQLYTFSSAGFNIITYDAGWLPSGTAVIAPGTGFFLRLPAGASATLTFVGEVPQGTLTIPLVPGFNLVGSMVPQAGGITTALKFTPVDGNQVYTYSSAGYAISTYDAGWLPSEPTLEVAQGVWIRRATAGSWDRTFDVNNPN